MSYLDKAVELIAHRYEQRWARPPTDPAYNSLREAIRRDLQDVEPFIREDERSKLGAANQEAIDAIDGMVAYLAESGLSEEGGGLALYPHIQRVSEARAALAQLGDIDGD